MQGCQRRVLLSLGRHHLITEMFSILLERRQFRQRAFAHEEILQRRSCAGIQALFDEACQAPALGGEYVADDGLQRRVARSYDLVSFQERQHLDQDKGRSYVASCQQRRHLDEGRPVCLRPESVAEQFYDLSPLRIPLVLAQRAERYRLSRKVAPQQEFNVFGREFSG